MLKIKKEPMTAEEVQPTWEMLVDLERKLQRNVRMSRILQPVGIVIFALNLLLATANIIRFIGGALVEEYFMSMPILPQLVEHLPRSSWVGVIVFSVLFVYLIPLAICGGIALIFYLMDRKKNEDEREPLFGTEIECAKALTNKAENVYVLRKKLKTQSIYTITGILTALLVLPILIALVQFLMGQSPAVFEIAIALIALLVCLFAVFWIYAGALKSFSLLNSLFYYAPSEWSVYLVYRRADAYWESIDPEEFARREKEEVGKKKKRKTAEYESEVPEEP